MKPVLVAVFLLAVSALVCQATFFPKKSYEEHHVDLTSHPGDGFSSGSAGGYQQQGSWGKKLVWKKRWERVCRPEWQQAWKKEWVSDWSSDSY